MVLSYQNRVIFVFILLCETFKILSAFSYDFMMIPGQSNQKTDALRLTLGLDVSPMLFHNLFGDGKQRYEGRFSYADKLALSLLCQTLGVSKSAAMIRLRQLGYLEERPYVEFVDPLEVWA